MYKVQTLITKDDMKANITYLYLRCYDYHEDHHRRPRTHSQSHITPNSQRSTSSFSHKYYTSHLFEIVSYGIKELFLFILKEYLMTIMTGDILHFPIFINFLFVLYFTRLELGRWAPHII